jgi:hypothetical protein
MATATSHFSCGIIVTSYHNHMQQYSQSHRVSTIKSNQVQHWNTNLRDRECKFIKGNILVLEIINRNSMK